MKAVRSSIEKWKDELREIPDIEEQDKGNSEARTTDYGHFNAQLTDYGHFNAPDPTSFQKASVPKPKKEDNSVPQASEWLKARNKEAQAAFDQLDDPKLGSLKPH